MSSERSSDATLWAEDEESVPAHEESEEVPVVILCDEDDPAGELSARIVARARGRGRDDKPRVFGGRRTRSEAGGEEDGEYEYADYGEEDLEDLDEVDEELLLERVEGDVDLELARELAEAGRTHRVRPVVILHGATGLALGMLAILLAVGWRYYRLALVERPLHALHDALRPSGAIGLTLGIAGTALMVGSLFYLLRKRLVAWRVPGNVRSWLDIHVLAGLVGPAFVIFHAAFAPSSALGLLAVAAMGIVVVSGAAGRWVHAHVPRSLEGHELEFEAIRRRLVVYQKKLVELGVDPTLLSDGSTTTMRRRAPWLVQAIVAVVWGDRESRREFARLRAAVREREELWESMERVLLLAWKLCREREALVRYRELRKVVGTWRFFHRWLAIVLFVAIFYHIAVALRFGNLWGSAG